MYELQPHAFRKYFTKLISAGGGPGHVQGYRIGALADDNETRANSLETCFL
jgi:hypothetical protein